VDLDIVTIGIYLGNDIECPADILPSQPRRNEKKNGIKDSIKRHSVLINYIFRQGKYYIPFLRSGTFERNLNILKDRSEISKKIIERQLAKIDTKIIDLSKSDLINASTFPHALVYPDYFSELYLLPDRTAWIEKLSCFLEYLSEFAKEIKEAGSEPIFILIPDSIVVAKRYHSYYERLGFHVEDNIHNV